MNGIVICLHDKLPKYNQIFKPKSVWFCLYLGSECETQTFEESRFTEFIKNKIELNDEMKFEIDPKRGQC